MSIEPGLEGTAERVVAPPDTAPAFGSGDVDVLATPAVVALCEVAAMKALAGKLPPDQTTVGVRIEVEHLAPTPPGAPVVARARLVGVDGRRLDFEIEASDPAGTVAKGTHARVVVDRARFMETARSRT